MVYAVNDKATLGLHLPVRPACFPPSLSYFSEEEQTLYFCFGYFLFLKEMYQVLLLTLFFFQTPLKTKKKKSML